MDDRQRSTYNLIMSPAEGLEVLRERPSCFIHEEQVDPLKSPGAQHRSLNQQFNLKYTKPPHVMQTVSSTATPVDFAVAVVLRTSPDIRWQFVLVLEKLMRPKA
jgi:hypothetical protein